uniref:Putative ovule protein n=1 Tax=Solanum chacoense TaxID=4108 RepID=A0A0V0HAK3_SOLCH
MLSTCLKHKFASNGHRGSSNYNFNFNIIAHGLPKKCNDLAHNFTVFWLIFPDFNIVFLSQFNHSISLLKLHHNLYRRVN